MNTGRARGRVGLSAGARARALAVSVLMAVSLAGCGSSDTGAAKTGVADVEAAKALIAPYVGQPSKFPISEPLKASPAGKKIAFMDCGTPVCGLIYSLAAPAAEALGMKMVRLQAGAAADTVDTAFGTAATGGFAGVIVPAIPPSLWDRHIAKLRENHIPVVSTGVAGVDTAKVAVAQIASARLQRDGELMAAYVVATYGADTDIVLYETPELDFSLVLGASFKEAMGRLCESCTVRETTIPIAAYGTQAPNLVVADAQAHPDTDVMVFSVGEAANGLAPAMRTAALKKTIVSYVPSPENLQQIKDGNMAAGMALDHSIIAWTLVDSIARLSTGQEVDPGAAQDISPTQFLTKDDLPDDVSKGWTGYPDYAERFRALWKDAS